MRQARVGRGLKAVGLVAVLAVTVVHPSRAQNEALVGIQKQISTLYTTAKATADGTDLVTAGSVLVLQKDHLVMSKVDQPIATANFYKNGAINQGGVGGLFKAMSLLSHLPGQSGAPQVPQVDTREFVAGEKFFVTQIATAPDGVTFALMSDPIKDQRYKATLKFLFAKGTVPSPDDAAALVAEVVKLDAPADGSAQSASDGGSAAAAAPAATKTISIGQTRDEVIAAFGVPSKVVHLGAKEIDFFADMKVTFLQNKVTNVE